MSPRTGRPTIEPKETTFKMRLSQNDIDKLEYLSSTYRISKAAVIRKGIDRLYSEEKK